MEAIQRYELIRPILQGEKSVKQVHQETKVPLSTLYRYLKRFREGNGTIETLADKSRGAHSHPHWFTSEQKELLVQYKLANPEKSARQISRDLEEKKILKISYHSVTNILKQRGLTEKFFLSNPSN